MKLIIVTRIILIAVTITLNISCGKSIKEAQDFVPNKPPVIDSFTVVDAQGNAVGKSNLVNNMTFSISASAHDPEGKPLQYNFSVTSGQGSFTEPVITDDTCTSTLTLTNIVKLENLSLNLSVVDVKKASANQSKFLGSGKNSPTITITQAPKSFMKPGDTTAVSFSIDGDGYYQLVYQPKSVTAVPSFDDDKPSFFYNFTKKGSFEVSRKISGPGYSGTDSSDLRITASGDAAYNAYILVRDYNNLEGSAAAPISIDGTLPVVTTTSLAAVDSKGQITIECVDANSTGETITVTSATLNNTGEACTVVSSTPNAVTGGMTFVLAPKTDWWITAPNGIVNFSIQDAAGNSATVPVTVPAYTSNVYVRSTVPSPTYTTDGTITRPFYPGTTGAVAQGVAQMSAVMTTYAGVTSGNVNIAADGTYSEPVPITIAKNISLLGGWKDMSFTTRDVRKNQSSVTVAVNNTSPAYAIGYSGTTAVPILGTQIVEGLNLTATTTQTSPNAILGVLYASFSNPVLRLNTVTSSSLVFICTIYGTNCSNLEIIGNFIFSTTQYDGIYINDPTSVTIIRNNCMYATGLNNGIIFLRASSINTTNIFVQNNSIYSEKVSTNDCFSVNITNTSPNIDNNLFFSGTTAHYTIFFSPVLSAKSVLNNYFGTSTINYVLYFPSVGYGVDWINNNSTSFGIVSGNFGTAATTTPPSVYIALGALTVASNNYLTTFNSTTPTLNDWHYTSSTPTSITSGGINLSDQFTTDFDGKVRPASGAWSIGAFQYP